MVECPRLNIDKHCNCSGIFLVGIFITLLFGFVVKLILDGKLNFLTEEKEENVTQLCESKRKIRRRNKRRFFENGTFERKIATENIVKEEKENIEKENVKSLDSSQENIKSLLKEKDREKPSKKEIQIARKNQDKKHLDFDIQFTGYHRVIRKKLDQTSNYPKNDQIDDNVLLGIPNTSRYATLKEIEENNIKHQEEKRKKFNEKLQMLFDDQEILKKFEHCKGIKFNNLVMMFYGDYIFQPVYTEYHKDGTFEPLSHNTRWKGCWHPNVIGVKLYDPEFKESTKTHSKEAVVIDFVDVGGFGYSYVRGEYLEVPEEFCFGNNKL
jgi:hypothetical protein